RSGCFVNRDLPVGRDADGAADVAACVISVANICRSEFAHLPALCRARRNVVLSAAEFDSGAALLGHGRGRGVAAIYLDYFFPFSLVGRTRCTLRTETSADRRPIGGRLWFRAFHPAGRGR